MFQSVYQKPLWTGSGVFSGSVEAKPHLLKKCSSFYVSCFPLQVSEHLRKLAQTVPMLLQSIASRLENDHSKELVTWSLVVLYLARQGTF